MPHRISHHLAAAQHAIIERLQTDLTGAERRAYQAAHHAVMQALALVRRLHHHRHTGQHLPDE